MKKQLCSKLYFDDLEEGDSFLTPSRTVSEADIMFFAGLTGDMNELHTSSQVASSSAFGERIAHGMLTLALANGLYMRMGYFDQATIANLGIEEWRFTSPVRIGDTLSVRVTLACKRATSKPDRGVVHWNIEVLNQRGDIVATGIWTKLLKTHP